MEGAPLLTMRSRWAGTGEAVDEVDASSSIQTRLGVALIHVVLAVHPLETGFALQRQDRGFWCRLGANVKPNPTPPSEMASPCTRKPPGNPCMWPHSGRGWTDTRPPCPRSSCPCTPADTGTGGNDPRSGTAPRSYTHSPPPHLSRRHSFKIRPVDPHLSSPGCS